MADLKQILFTYLAHRHIDLMPPDVADRFDDYKKNSSFIGHMKDWTKLYYDKPIEMLDATITGPDAEDNWEKFFDSCQDALQQMYENKEHSVGIGSDYNPATKGFIDKWFGTNPYKTFTASKSSNDTKEVFDWLAKFLGDPAHIALKLPLTKGIPSVFGDMTYEKFCKDLKSGKYNEDFKFRKKVRAVIDYIRSYGPKIGYPVPEAEYWPPNVGYASVGGIVDRFTNVDGHDLDWINGLPDPKLPLDVDQWYTIHDKTTHIDWFKRDYVKIFDEILTNSVIRQKFLEMADDPIASALRVAIEDTDYENKESDDYVPPDISDSKNWHQRFKKWKNDTYENHFRRFVNPSRGARIFFSPHSQNIMKGFDKAGIKPTDGLEGILSKKDDPKLQNAVNADPNTRKHFKWFTDKLAELKTETSDDFEGALKDGLHLRNLVINIIIKASKENKLNEAMTALEVLSVAKFGLLCSKTFDKLAEATKDMKIFSDEKLSWNQNKGVQVVTKAVDKTLGAALKGVTLAAVGLRNLISHSRTKINTNLGKTVMDKYVGKSENLYNAYKKWDEEDKKRHQDIRNSNEAHNVAGILAELDNPARAIVAPYKTNIQINKDNIGKDDEPGTIKGELKAAHDAGLPDVMGFPIDDVQNDVDLYDDAKGRSDQDTKWREKNPDIMHDLILYWNFLETASKTHSFTLGDMSAKRKALLKGFDLKEKTSEAQQKAWEYINAGGISYAA